MDNGIYIMLSRQTGLFRQMDVVANNIANMDTTGYRAEKTMFDDYLVKDRNTGEKNMAFAQDVSSYRDTGQGMMKVTHNALDVGINGKGYFVIETAQGEGYTRAGNFQLDAVGTLVNAEGLPVLDDAGQRIEFQQEDRDIVIGENGLIMVDGDERSTLGVVEFEFPQFMKQQGGSIFATDQEPLPPENSRVLHGVLERSNVAAVREVVDMTKTSRSVASTAKYIEVMYELQRKAHSTYAQRSN